MATKQIVRSVAPVKEGMMFFEELKLAIGLASMALGAFLIGRHVGYGAGIDHATSEILTAMFPDPAERERYLAGIDRGES